MKKEKEAGNGPKKTFKLPSLISSWWTFKLVDF